MGASFFRTRAARFARLQRPNIISIWPTSYEHFQGTGSLATSFRLDISYFASAHRPRLEVNLTNAETAKTGVDQFHVSASVLPPEYRCLNSAFTLVRDDNGISSIEPPR